MSPTASRQSASHGSEHIVQAAEERLRASSYPELRAISCDFDDGVLVLRGPVRSFHMKQLAQEFVGRLGLDARLSNQIEVVDASVV